MLSRIKSLLRMGRRSGLPDSPSDLVRRPGQDAEEDDRSSEACPGPPATQRPNHTTEFDTALAATPKRPTRTFAQFFEHVKSFDFNPGTVIDVGVAKGTPPLYEAFPDAYFVLVEPVEEFVPDLEQIVAKYRGEYHTCALTDEPGPAAILKTKHLHGSTLMHRIQGDDERLQSVENKTLDGLLGERDLDGPVLLKTDCQGGDLNVLKGGADVLRRCELVIVEVSLFRFWGDHHPDPLDILSFMDAHGFVMYDFLDGLFRPSDNALGQIDIAFVKRDGLFRRSRAW